MRFPPYWSKAIFPLLPALAGVGYFSLLPHFIQGGDAAELVAAAYLRLVAHPPGYPLWIWVLHFFTHALTTGSIFWRASLGCALFAVASLACLGYPLRRQPVALLICLPLLALSAPFLYNALLPDVFSLHALFLAAAGFLFLFREKEEKARQFFLPFFLTLGFANHQTIVLLYPLLLSQTLEARAHPAVLRRILLGCLTGLTLAAALYGSLLFFLHPESFFSWGALQGPGDLLRHIFRADYGLFRLTPAEGGYSLAPLLFFLSGPLAQAAPLALFPLWALYRYPTLRKDSRLHVWGFCFLLSLFFFLAQNIVPQGSGAEVLARFHLMPLLLLAFLCAYLLQRVEFSGRERWLALAFTAPFTIYLFTGALDLRALRTDSVIEDYSRNLLTQAQARKPALLLVESDSAFFGLRYLQSVQGEAKDVIVANLPLFFHPWFTKKIWAVAPGFQLPRAEKIWESRELDPVPDLVQPNFSRFAVVVPQAFLSPESFQLTFLGLGRVLSTGRGISFAPESLALMQWQSRPTNSARYPQAHTKRLLFSQYSFYHLARGVQRHREGKHVEALEEWNQALTKVPYALPALLNICQATKEKDPRCAPENLESVRRASQGIF